MANAIETTSPAEVVRLVKKFGVAIWRRLVPPEITSAILAPAEEHLQRPESYASLRYGVLNLNILPADLQAACVVPEISEVYSAALGPHEVSIREIYLTRPGFFHPHEWHQDANAKNRRYHFMTWIAATPCGLYAPGLSFALGNPGEYLPGGPADVVEKSAVISPIFEPGDAFFFDVFSIHKTNQTEEMPLSRVAYKLGAQKI